VRTPDTSLTERATSSLLRVATIGHEMDEFCRQCKSPEVSLSSNLDRHAVPLAHVGVVRYNSSAPASAPRDAEDALPHRMLTPPSFLRSENRDVGLKAIPEIYASHFCVLWAILCREFAEREDAVQLCKVRSRCTLYFRRTCSWHKHRRKYAYALEA
jgi:hypothetical protein